MRVVVGVGVAVLLAACGAQRSSGGGPTGRVEGPVRVAVLPFRTGGLLGAGAVFIPDRPLLAAPEDMGETTAAGLGDRLAALGVAVSDAAVVAVVARVLDGASYDTGLASRVAQKCGATLAVLGAITRFEQREGNSWAVRTPASVEYEVALVRASDGAVVLLDRFAHTQQALSENLLDLPRFLRAGGRWLTREEMLVGALAETAGKLAAATRGGPPVRSGRAEAPR
jgi:hypothetical protein